MALPLVGIGDLDAPTAERLLARAGGQEPTGSGGSAPATSSGGSFATARVVGHGDRNFGAAAAAVLGLHMQRSVATVLPDGAMAAEGATVLIVLRIGPIRVVAVNRIAGVIDEPDRAGFEYTTLPGHIERGRESFLVERQADGTVLATIEGQADLALPGGALARPVLRPLQRRYAEHYLDAVEAAVAAGGTSAAP